MKVRTVRYSSPSASKEFAQSLRETGFAVVTDHPIPTQLIYDTYSEWERFFASSTKGSHQYDSKSQAGYFPFRSENAKDHSVKDLKEFYHYYPGRRELPESARSSTPVLYQRIVEMASGLLAWLENETPEEVRGRFPIRLQDMIRDSGDTLFRILHYPPLNGCEEQGAVRAAAHEDINLITLLPAATAPGLEVKDRQGNWHSVSCDPGMIVVNSGDMLKEASHGYYPSTTHRVVNPKGPESKLPRYSMPLFLHPRREVPLTQTRTAGAFLDERLREIGLL